VVLTQKGALSEGVGRVSTYHCQSLRPSPSVRHQRAVSLQLRLAAPRGLDE
jgi:hypothetical protein